MRRTRALVADGRVGDVPAGGAGEGPIGRGVVDDLRVVNPEAAADHGLSIPMPVVRKPDAWSEILTRIGERLLFVTQAQVDGKV